MESWVEAMTYTSNEASEVRAEQHSVVVATRDMLAMAWARSKDRVEPYRQKVKRGRELDVKARLDVEEHAAELRAVVDEARRVLRDMPGKSLLSPPNKRLWDRIVRTLDQTSGALKLIDAAKWSAADRHYREVTTHDVPTWAVFTGSEQVFGVGEDTVRALIQGFWGTALTEAMPTLMAKRERMSAGDARRFDEKIDQYLGGRREPLIAWAKEHGMRDAFRMPEVWKVAGQRILMAPAILRSGYYGQAMVFLRRAIANLFYLTDSGTGRLTHQLQGAEWEAWSDPFKSPYDQARDSYGGIRGEIERQAEEKARRQSRYVEILSPDGDILYLADPYTGGSIVQRTAGRTPPVYAAFKTNARSAHELHRAIWATGVD